MPRGCFIPEAIITFRNLPSRRATSIRSRSASVQYKLLAIQSIARPSGAGKPTQWEDFGSLYLVKNVIIQKTIKKNNVLQLKSRRHTMLEPHCMGVETTLYGRRSNVHITSCACWEASYVLYF